VLKDSLLVATVCSVLLLSMPISAADWPNFRGPGHDGISPEEGIHKDWRDSPPEILWEVELSDEGYAGPAVADGVLYIVDHEGSDDVVRAIDTRNGKDIWTYRYPETSRDNYGHARATPSVDQGRVYTLSRKGLLLSLDAKTGGKIWSRNILDDFRGKSPKYEMSFSPLIDGEKLIICPGGKQSAVAALDKSTGRTLWKGGGSDQPGYATPVAAVIEGRPQYVVFTGVSLIGVNRSDGALLWRLPWQTSHDVNAATPIVLGDDVFITSGYNHGCALVRVQSGTAAAAWQSRDLVGHFNSPIYWKGYVYGIGDPGELVCLDPKTGTLAWSERGFEKGGVVGVDGMLIALNGNKGHVVLVEMTPEEYRERGRIRPLGGRSWTAPIVAGGRLYIRNEDKLACLSLK
jgi:outer membrane protein assembly factor BamB